MFDSPYLIYILAAYGLSLVGLGVFFGWTFFAWRKSSRKLKNVSRET